jgi:hypothetical protein
LSARSFLACVVWTLPRTCPDALHSVLLHQLSRVRRSVLELKRGLGTQQEPVSSCAAAPEAARIRLKPQLHYMSPSHCYSISLLLLEGWASRSFEPRRVLKVFAARGGRMERRDGRKAGRREGWETGVSAGFGVGGEVGFYSGCSDVWAHYAAAHPTLWSERAVKAIGALQRLIAGTTARACSWLHCSARFSVRALWPSPSDRRGHVWRQLGRCTHTDRSIGFLLDPDVRCSEPDGLSVSADGLRLPACCSVPTGRRGE